MTKKRFKQVSDGVKDTRTGRTLTHPLDFTLKLNEINDLYDCVFDRNEQLEKENIRLKKERNHFERKKTEYLTEWNKSRIQNTEIKNTIQEAYNTERTEIGKNTLKQLLEQI